MRSQAAALGSLVLAVVIALASTQFEGHRLRTGLIMTALFGVGVSRVAVGNQVEQNRIMEDITDVSDAQRQQRLYEVMKPGAEPMAIASGDEPLEPDPDYLEIFWRSLDYPVVSVHGPQGTGKTTLVQWLSTALNGRQVVLDPHYLLGDWPGCEVVGAGADYKAIDDALLDAMALNKTRYKERAKGVAEFDPVSYIAEELTSWAGKVPSSGEFIRMTLSDFRKANQRLIKVSHGRTNTTQGGAAGTAKMRAEGEVEIHLLRKGRARVTFPFEEPVEFDFPLLRPGTSRPVEPPAVTAEPTDQHRAQAQPPELPEGGAAVISAIAAEMERNGGRLRSDFLKEDLGMRGRNYAGAKKLIEVLFNGDDTNEAA